MSYSHKRLQLIMNSQSISPPPTEASNDTFRPVSSIYSEPSPNKIDAKYTQSSYDIQESTYQDDDVSPPSSPEFGADRYVSSCTSP